MNLKHLSIAVCGFVLISCGGGGSDNGALPTTNIQTPSGSNDQTDKNDQTLINEQPKPPTTPRAYASLYETLLSWEPSIDSDGSIQSYDVSYKIAGTSQWSESQRVYEPNVTIQDLKPNSSYEFRIQAIDNQGSTSPYLYTNTLATQPTKEGKAIVLIQGLNESLNDWSLMTTALSKEMGDSNGSYVEIGMEIAIDPNAKCWNVNVLDYQMPCSQLTNVQYTSPFRSDSYFLYAKDRIFGLDKGQFDVVSIDWRKHGNSKFTNDAIEKNYNFGNNRVFVINFTNNDQLSFDAQGVQLKAAMDDIAKVTGIGEYVLIGHYTGGLAARAYIQNEKTQKITKLITLNTPHQGAKDLAVLVAELYTYYTSAISWWDSLIDTIASIYDATTLDGLIDAISSKGDVHNAPPTHNTGNKTLDQILNIQDQIKLGGIEQYAAIAGGIYRGVSQNAGVNAASGSLAMARLNDRELLANKYDAIEVHLLGYSDEKWSLVESYVDGDGKSYIGSQLGLDVFNDYRVIFTPEFGEDARYTQDITSLTQTNYADKVVYTTNYNTLFAFDDEDANAQIVQDKMYIDYVAQAINHSGEEIVSHFGIVELYNNTDYTLSQLYIKKSSSNLWGDDYLTYFDNIDSNEYSELIGVETCDNYYDIKALEYQTTGDLIENRMEFVNSAIHLPCETKTTIKAAKVATLSVYNATNFLLDKDGIYQLYVKESGSSDWGSDLIEGIDYSISSKSSKRITIYTCGTTVDIKATGLLGSPEWTTSKYIECDTTQNITVLFLD